VSRESRIARTNDHLSYKMESATREGLLPAILPMILPFGIPWVLIRSLPPWGHDEQPHSQQA